MQKNGLTTYKIATAYIGTVVGAGFASGQELLQFFVIFGRKGFIGLLLVTGLFMFFGYKIMICGMMIQSKTHEDIIQHACGKRLGSVIDFITTFFLFGSLTAMIAGTGALFSQLFHIPSIYGNIFMSFITALTVITGINGIINSISIVVPFLMISTIGIGIATLFLPSSNPDAIFHSMQINPLIKSWWWSAILYGSYNILLSISILGPLGVNAKNKSSIRNGAILGSLGLGICASSIFIALFRNTSNVISIEIPLIYITRLLSPVLQYIYFIILVSEIYSTAIGSLYGFASRMTVQTKGSKKLPVIYISLFALVASQLGFSTLVKNFYPIVGYTGLVLLICFTFFKEKPFEEL